MRSGRITFLVVALIGVSLALSMCLREPLPRAETKTRYILANVLRFVEQKQLISNGGTLDRSETNSLGLNRAIAERARSDKECSRFLAFSTNNPVELLDAWGRPLNLSWRLDLGPQNPWVLLKETNRLAVWSSGKNGSNEFGNGDDITVSADWVSEHLPRPRD